MPLSRDEFDNAMEQISYICISNNSNDREFIIRTNVVYDIFKKYVAEKPTLTVSQVKAMILNKKLELLRLANTSKLMTDILGLECAAKKLQELLKEIEEAERDQSNK